MLTAKNFINGKWVDAESGKTFNVTNPASFDEVVGTCAQSGPGDVVKAIEAAQAAQPAWAAMPAPKRGEILLRAARILESRTAEIAELLTREEGKTLPESKGEVTRAVRILEYFGGEGTRLSGDVIPSERDRVFLMSIREPLGVVALIAPWNFPIAIPAWKLGPALISGNAVVIKPSSLAPFQTIKLVEVLVEAGIPAGVLNLVTGGGSAIGNELVTHPAIKAVSFTGSVEVGNKIYALTSKNMVRTQLEMGGKNPTIVLADADLEEAAAVTANAAFMSTGQKCTATSRAIVERPVLEKFTQLIVAKAKAMKVGDGMKPDSNMGPAVDENQLKTDLDYIEIGKKEGAKLLCGGNRVTGDGFDKGYFVEPTVFGDVKPDMRIAQEEIFGPVLAIIPADDFADAMRIANGVKFGLSAALCTKDITRIMDYVNQIQAGTIMVNLPSAGLDYQCPFGGVKASSSGFREQGPVAIQFYTQIKTAYIKY